MTCLIPAESPASENAAVLTHPSRPHQYSRFLGLSRKALSLVKRTERRLSSHCCQTNATQRIRGTLASSETEGNVRMNWRHVPGSECRLSRKRRLCVGDCLRVGVVYALAFLVYLRLFRCFQSSICIYVPH